MQRTLVVVPVAVAVLSGWYLSQNAGVEGSSSSAAPTEGAAATASRSSLEEDAHDNKASTVDSADPAAHAASVSNRSSSTVPEARERASTRRREVASSRYAVAPDLRERIRAADALPAERRVLSGGRLHLHSTMELIGSDDFSQALDELALEASADIDAKAMSDVYRDYVESVLQAGGEFALDRLACGMRACLGQAFPLVDEADWHRFGLYALRDGGPPMYAVMADRFQGADGNLFYHFVFTIDPESPGMVISSP
jgi:hypothetical protein